MELIAGRGCGFGLREHGLDPRGEPREVRFSALQPFYPKAGFKYDDGWQGNFIHEKGERIDVGPEFSDRDGISSRVIDERGIAHLDIQGNQACLDLPEAHIRAENLRHRLRYEGTDFGGKGVALDVDLQDHQGDEEYQCCHDGEFFHGSTGRRGRAPVSRPFAVALRVRLIPSPGGGPLLSCSTAKIL